MASRVDAVRAFNRFYTRQVGALGAHRLDSRFSLTEMRVLYELAHRDAPTATGLGRDLGLDAGYLSRILRRFDNGGLTSRTLSPGDARQSLLHLTRKGRAAFVPLEARAREAVAALLGRIGAAEQRQVVEAMATIQALLDTPGTGAPRAGSTRRPASAAWRRNRIPASAAPT